MARSVEKSTSPFYTIRVMNIRNLSLNRLEKALAKKRGGGEAEVAIDELGQCLEDKTIQNAEQLEESLVIREVMDQFMAGLKPQNRRIFVRRYWYCSSVREIGVKLTKKLRIITD